MGILDSGHNETCENIDGCDSAATHKVDHPQFKRASLMCEPHANEFAESMRRYGYPAVTVTQRMNYAGTPYVS